MPEKNKLKPYHIDLLNILDAFPQGSKMKDLSSALVEEIPRRTLLRHLTELKKMDFVRSSGERNQVRYFSCNKPTLNISPAGQALLEKIRLPKSQRKPVAYNPEFLYAYIPNETYYLPKTLRAHLRKIGTPYEKKLEPSTYIKRILSQLLIDLSWNSSRLEGNTYSLLDTERLIEFSATAKGKDAVETQMIVNHKDAIEFMLQQVSDGNATNKYTILNIHAFLSNNLISNPKARGNLRKVPVGIGKTVYHPPEIPQLISACFDQIILTLSKIKDPFEAAFFAMVHIPYLQPFEDVNKRTSRLSANLPLLSNSFAPLSFIDVPKNDYISGLLAIYELNKVELLRDVFAFAYERSAAQYKVVLDTIGQPNLLQMKFKSELYQLINLIISENIHGAEILEKIQSWTQDNIDKTSRQQFSIMTEREVSSLHEGNIAIYGIKHEVFSKWKQG